MLLAGVVPSGVTITSARAGPREATAAAISGKPPESLSLEDCRKYPTSVGPWGGETGIGWDDGVHSTVRQLVIVHGAGINSIQIEYDENGNSAWSKMHGGVGGIKTDQVKLDHPDEFLASIHGHYGSLSEWGPIFIRSLTFESNRKSYGPFGTEQGTYFSFPVTGGEIVGFHGKCSWYLDAIGAYLKPQNIQNPSSKVGGPIKYGPWGGIGGKMFEDGRNTGVWQINISRNVGIVSIQVLYDQKGQAVWGNKHGGSGGFKTDKIVFDYPYEILTHITGIYGPVMLMGPTVIRSLTFHTTKEKYGPFGEEQGTSTFSTNLKQGKIVGFHGRKGMFIDAIGVHVILGNVMLPVRPPSISLNQTNPSIAEVNEHQWSNQLGVSGVIKQPAPCEPGPWGGDEGRPWDDGVFSGIKQIYLTRAEAICSIQIEYDRNGQSVWSVKHGGDGGRTTIRVRFKYPHEVLKCICGYYGSISRDEQPKAIKSLTFYTNREKYGPYGEEIGTFFTSTMTEGKVVGFHGRSSLYLNAIGIHMQHWLENQKPAKSPFFQIFN